MRGKVAWYYVSGVAIGITPAYAGKRLLPSSGDTRARDHPRVCGEKQSWASNPSPGKGSPPRMRGKGSAPVPAWRRGRITPAYAGKRSSCSTETVVRRDHPRVCGEKAFLFEVEVDFLRITPAYAGKRSSPTRQTGR